jgi:polysaccharide pyruvyl transferase WcaK-like protein
MNILFSSTRQWNPGDEFIYFGIKNLLLELGLKFNTVLYNRNPLVRCEMFQPEKGRERLPPLSDNSYLHYPSKDIIDYIIYAGTPEWAGARLTVVRDLIYEKRIRFSIIGVGCKKRFTQRFKDALKSQADIIIARDEGAYQCLQAYGGVSLADPSIFASKKEYPKIKLEKVGICFQQLNRFKRNDETIAVYKKIIKAFDAKIICHTYIDFMFAHQIFPRNIIVYSSYAEDYFDLYKECDAILGTRVHGSGLASSMGIPSILIPHDERANAGVLLLAHMEQPENILKILARMNIEQESKHLIRYKAEQKHRYIKIMAEMSIVPGR